MKIYLSRLLLNPRSRQVRSELAFPYEMHRTIMHAFDDHFVEGEKDARRNAGVLFRADIDQRTGDVTVYVQSTKKPNWEYVSRYKDYLVLGHHKPNPALRPISETLSKLHAGQLLSFRLCANPTKRISKNARPDDPLAGKRVGLRREEEQIDWIIRKGQRSGFEIPEIIIDDPEAHVPRVRVASFERKIGRKREGGKACQMTHFSVLFDGLLRVTDANAFRRALTRGIGSAKAYGFGLLSIAPPGVQ